jgi:hypothetical protein
MGTSKLVVASFHKMAQVDGKFAKELAKCEREKVLVTRAFVESFNEHSETSGAFYKIDEEATLKALAEIEAQENAAKEKEEEVEELKSKIKKVTNKQ